MDATIGQTPTMPTSKSKSNGHQRKGYTIRQTECSSKVNFVFRGENTCGKSCSRCHQQLFYKDLRGGSSPKQDGRGCTTTTKHVLQSGIYPSSANTDHQGHRRMGTESMRAVSKLNQGAADNVMQDAAEFNLPSSTARAMLAKKAGVAVLPADVRNGLNRAAAAAGGSVPSSQGAQSPEDMIKVLDADDDTAYIAVSSILKVGTTTVASETKKLVIVKLSNGTKYDASLAYEKACKDTNWCVAKWLCDPTKEPPRDSWTELSKGDASVTFEPGTILRNEMVLWAKKQELQRASRCMQFGAFDCTHKVSSAASVFLAWVFKDAENKTVNAVNGMLLNESACNFRNLVEFALPVFYGAAVTQCYATALDGDVNEHSAVDTFTAGGVVSQETAIDMLATAVATAVSASATMAVNGHCRILCYWHAVTKPFLTMLSKCNPTDFDRSLAWTVYHWMWSILINSETVAELSAGHSRLQRALWGGKVKVHRTGTSGKDPAVNRSNTSKSYSNGSYEVGAFKRFSTCDSMHDEPMHTVTVQWKGYDDETEESMNKLYTDLGADVFKRFTTSAGLTIPSGWTPPAMPQKRVAFRNATIFESLLAFLDCIWPKRKHLATVYRRGLLSLGGRTSGMAEAYFRVVKYCNDGNVGSTTRLDRFVHSTLKLEARRVDTGTAVQGKKKVRVQASSKTIPDALLAELSKKLVEHCVHLLEDEFSSAFGEHQRERTPKYSCRLRTHDGETVWQIQSLHVRPCPAGLDEHDEPFRTRVVRRDKDGYLQCTCNYYEEFGIVCRHMLLVVDGKISFDMMHYRWWSQIFFGELDDLLWKKLFVNPRPPGPHAPDTLFRPNREDIDGLPRRASKGESISDCWYEERDTAGASFIELTTCTGSAAGRHLAVPIAMPHSSTPSDLQDQPMQPKPSDCPVDGPESGAASNTGTTGTILQFDGREINERDAFQARNRIKASLEAALAMVHTGQSTTYINKVMFMIAGVVELNEAFTLKNTLDDVFDHPTRYLSIPQRATTDTPGCHRIKAAYEMRGTSKPRKRKQNKYGTRLSKRLTGQSSREEDASGASGGAAGHSSDSDDSDSTESSEDRNAGLQYDCLAWQAIKGSDSHTWYFLCDNTWASHRALQDRYGHGMHLVAVAKLQLSHDWKKDCERRQIIPAMKPDGYKCRYCKRDEAAEKNKPGQTP